MHARARVLPEEFSMMGETKTLLSTHEQILATTTTISLTMTSKSEMCNGTRCRAGHNVYDHASLLLAAGTRRRFMHSFKTN